MTSDGRRSRRVAEIIRGYVSEALTRELDDPLLAALVLTHVEVPDDLSVARIRVRLLVGDDDEAARRNALRNLHRAATRIRRGLAPKLKLRRVPELKFDYDTGHDAEKRVDELLREIEADPKGSD